MCRRARPFLGAPAASLPDCAEVGAIMGGSARSVHCSCADQLIADEAVRSAEQHGVRVITVDGSLDAFAVAEIVAGHFSPYLPQPAAVA